MTFDGATVDLRTADGTKHSMLNAQVKRAAEASGQDGEPAPASLLFVQPVPASMG